MGLFSVMSVGANGMAAQTAALTTTGQNIANVNTPGYAKRTAVLQTTTAGGGVVYSQTARNVDQFALSRVTDESGKKGAAQARSDALTQTESTIAPTSNSIGDRATDLIKAFNALAAYPIDPSLRADVIAKTQDFANTVKNTSTALQSQQSDLLSQAGDTLKSLNNNLNQIADLNKQIAIAQASGGDSASLKDQRDVLVNSVGGQIGAKTVEGSDGQITLYAAGSVLVSSDSASQLSMSLDSSTNQMRFFSTAKGGNPQEITSQVTTGTLGGIKETRDSDIAATLSNLDSYAYDVANTMNTQHEAGVDLNGNQGQALFNVSSTQQGAAASLSINQNLVGNPNLIAASDTSGNLPGGNNNMLALSNLADTQSFGGATLADRFANITTDIGFRKQGADQELQLRTDTLATAQQLSDSANGVSIDEETVNLSQYQRAFEASSKVMQTADELMQTLMDIV